MKTFVQDTGLQGVLVRTAVPIQNWRSKLGSFPYATDGLTFVRETKTYDKFPYDRFREFNWQVIFDPGKGKNVYSIYMRECHHLCSEFVR